MPTKTQLQPAAVRLKATQSEIASLHAEETRIEEAVADAMLRGEDTDDLNAKRIGIAVRLQNLALLARELERLAQIDERKRLLSEQDAAFARSQVLADKRARQTDAVNEAARTLADAERELLALKNESPGTFSAAQFLDRHRAEFPWIDEESLNA